MFQTWENAPFRNRSIQIFYRIVSVSNKFHDLLAAIRGRSKGRIHPVPDVSIKENGSVNPTAFLCPDTDPGMVYGSCVPHHQFAWDLLASEHCGHHGSIIKADTGAAFQNIIQYGKITALNRLGFLNVVLQMAYNIVIYGCNLFNGID